MKRRKMDEEILPLLILGLIMISIMVVSSSTTFIDRTNTMISEAAAYALSAPSRATSSSVATIENEEARGKIIEAFKAVADAEEKGGDVIPLVIELNSALDLIREAEFTKDEALMKEALIGLDEVIEKAPKVGQQGIAASRWKQINTIVALGIEVSLALIAYIYAPQAFWKIWIKVKGKWRVKAVDGR